MAINRTLTLTILLFLVAAVGVVAAYTTLVRLVHIEVGPSGEVSVWEEDVEPPIKKAYPSSHEQLRRKLFGEENPTILDAVRRVVEEEVGRRKVEELLRRYDKIYFSAIAYPIPERSIEVIAYPLARPKSPIIFKFHYNEAKGSFSLEIVEEVRGVKWHYRSVTDEELKELLSLHDISRYNNTFFVASEAISGPSDALSLDGFAWEDKAIDVGGFKAYRGVQVSVTYQGGRKLIEEVNKIIVIGA